MNSIKVDFAIHFEASGPVDIPAGAEVFFDDDGQYTGYVAADGAVVAHRGQEAAMTASSEPSTITITPAPEPAPESEPEPEPEEPVAA